MTDSLLSNRRPPKLPAFAASGAEYRHLQSRWSFVTCCLLGSALVSGAEAQEWTRFRGPNGSGVSTAATVPVRWTAQDCNWKIELPGVGHSSPVLWGERLFVTSADEKTGKRFLLCLRVRDGERLWSREFAGERVGKHADNSFATATPAVDSQHVYVCWGNAREYLVAALDHDGKEVWRADLGQFRSGHGFGPSPIVHGDVLVVPCDQDGPSALFGLERTTGKVLWKVPRRSKATYTTPCVYQPKGRPDELIVTSYEHGISSIDPKTGRVKWNSRSSTSGILKRPSARPWSPAILFSGHVAGWG